MNMMRLLFHWERYEEVKFIFVNDFQYDVRFMQGSVMLDIWLYIIIKLSSIITQLPDGWQPRGRESFSATTLSWFRNEDLLCNHGSTSSCRMLAGVDFDEGKTSDTQKKHPFYL